MLGSLVRGGLMAAMLAFAANSVRAAEPLDLPEQGFDNPPALSPAEALDTFRMQHGFSLQLVAAEPLLVDPVEVTYDEYGRAYVVEMRGYPLPEKPEQPRPEPMSRVRLLFDDDADGRFDRSTVFLEGLDWPTSVCLWQGGVFVADAPHVWYAKDTDGDGVANVRRKVLTGFKQDNVQALLNNLKWGLDHRIYGAASGNGGTVSIVARPAEPPVTVSRRDFRFDPLSESITAISGGARFGSSFDDWGARFLCNIRNPVQHVILPLEPLQRNPFLTVPSLLHDVAESGETLPVFRISPVEAWREYRARRWVRERVNYPRSELVGAGFFTSSSGVTIYRGDAYPPEVYGQAFVADVAANIVHREALTADGISFRGARVDEGAEFVASTDIWFRPVNFTNAPDGTLHIVDMYRLNIEHPWSIPDDIRAKLDLTAGSDRGRIWRLVPPDYEQRPIPLLGTATIAELVQELASRNSWRRETAHRLLWERQDRAAIPLLRELRDASPEPLARLHVLWSLEGLQALNWTDVAAAFADPHAGVREHALQLAASRFPGDPRTRLLAIAAAGDDALRVRLHAAFTLGDFDEDDAITALATIASRDVADEWLRLAVLSAPPRRALGLLRAVLTQPTFAKESAANEGSGAATLLQELGRIIGVSDGASTPDQLTAGQTLPLVWELAIWSGWVTGSQQRLRGTDNAAGRELLKSDTWQDLHRRASQAIADENQPVPLRLQALSLLRMDSLEHVGELMEQLLSPRQPRELQLAAVRAVGAYGTPDAARRLIERYRLQSPAVRAEIVNLLAARPAWHAALFAALAERVIAPADVPVVRRALLLRQADPGLLAAAEKWFGASAASSRQAALDANAHCLTLTTDRQRGFAVFRRECAQCHRSQGQGFEVGPPLSLIRNRSPEELLTHILDPNREVGPNYVDYVANLTDGRSLTGLLSNETDSQVTLLRPQGVSDVVPRSDIDELVSSGKSLMPEGLEQRLTPQELADVIDYLLHPDADVSHMAQ